MKKEKEYSFLTNALFIHGKVQKYAPILRFLYIIHIPFKALPPIILVLASRVIPNMITVGASIHRLLMVCAGISLGTLITMALDRITWNKIWPLVIKLRFDMLGELGKKAMEMDYEYTESPDVLTKLQNARIASSDNQKGIAGFLLQTAKVGPAIITSAFCAITIVLIHPLLLIPVILVTSITFVATKRHQLFDYDKNIEMNEVDRVKEVFGNIMWNFGLGKEIRIFRLAKLLLQKFQLLSSQNQEVFSTVEKNKFKHSCFIEMMNFVLEASMYVFLIIQATSSRIAISDFLMVSVAIRSFSASMAQSLTLGAQLMKSSREISDYRIFVDYESSLAKPNDFSKLYQVITEMREIEFRNVSFRYPNTKTFVLSNISFSLVAGEKLALIGPNGSGKTTLIKLLMRLYDPTEGNIYINGIDIKEIEIKQYYRLFSVMFQDTHVYAFPLIENITMGKSENADVNRAWAAVEAADLMQKLMQLPNALDTMMLKLLDDSGVEFSGGENQKLAFARAIYKDAPIMILDEPTASLDAFSEETLYNTMEHMTYSKTIVFISHRLSSVKICDKIILLENGIIAESGNHETLIRLQGKYNALYSKQADLYVGDETRA